MKQNDSSRRMIQLCTAFILVASLLTACNSQVGKAGNDVDSLTVTSEDSMQTSAATEPENPQQIAECKAFLEEFYKGMDEELDDDYIRSHVTKNAEQWLKDSFDYDCPDDNCIASWLFTYDITDPGVLQERTIEALDNDTYEVKMTYDRENGEFYEYILKLDLVKEGYEYKVDAIETVSSRTWEN